MLVKIQKESTITDSSQIKNNVLYEVDVLNEKKVMVN
jgi:hypothetical protein